MGGFGSGRHGGRARGEGCRSMTLDVNRVARGVRDALRDLPEGEVVKAGPFRWTWTLGGEAEPWATVVLALTLGRHRGHARLLFDVDHHSRRTGPQDQRIAMETTPCRFGGVRWWWVCPATGRRCATLYLPNGGTLFLSRGKGAYDLAYASQNGSAMDRSHARQRRLYASLGGEYQYFEQPLPPRPKGMRRATYGRTVNRIFEAMERHDDIFVAGAARLLARVGRGR